MEVSFSTYPEIKKTVSHVFVEPNDDNKTSGFDSPETKEDPGNRTDVREMLSLVKKSQNQLSEAILQVQGTQEGEREKQFLVLKKMGISTALRQFAKRLRDSQLLLENTLEDYQEYKNLWKKAKKRKKTEGGTKEKEDGNVARGGEGEREIAEPTEGEKERGDGGESGGVAAERGEGGEKGEGGERGEGGEEGERAEEQEGRAEGGERGERGDRGERGGETEERGGRGGGEGGGEERCTVDVKELISYAHKISYTTFAPPEFAQGLGLLGALPPLPQDEQMRASALYQFTDEDLGVPKLETTETLIPETLISKNPVSKTPETLIPGTLKKDSLSPFAQEVGGGVGGAPGVKKEGINGVPVPPRPPPGWKPGDPITLLPELGALPPPPPGWKPGDPIPLPPMPTTSVSGRPPLPVPRGVPPPPPPPTTVQVRHVELDLNPELEDSDSDYSGSSDED